MAYGVAQQAILFPYESGSWNLIPKVFFRPYFQVYGELFIEDTSHGMLPLFVFPIKTKDAEEKQMSNEKPSKGMILAGGVRFYELQKKRSLKNIELTGFKPMPLDTRWVLLPAELRSHTLRARQKRLLLCSDCKPNF